MSSAMRTPIPFSIKGPHSVKSAAGDFHKERYVLTFDFETNALPHESVAWDNFEPEPTFKKYANGDLMKDRATRQPIPMPASDASKWPHSVQFCYILYDNREKTAKIVNKIIRLPAGVEMSAESEAVHKISLAQTQDPKNPEIHEVLQEFMGDFELADVIVAHNLRFDRNMLLAEMDRLRKSGKPEFEVFNEYIRNLYENKKEFCTANFGADVCQIAATNKAGKEYYKMPKLNALYEHLFGYAPDESKLHDALMDVVICMRCFYKIRYDVDLCQTPLDAAILRYIDELSPEGFKCAPSLKGEEKSSRVLTVAEAFATLRRSAARAKSAFSGDQGSGVKKRTATKKRKSKSRRGRGNKGKKSRGKRSRK
jgi:DNA polymerase III epsilon subunit-like protein